MKEGWEEKFWKQVLDIRSGRNQRAVENPNGNYPILGSAGKVMGYADDYICEEGTTIIGRKGTIDNPMYFDTKLWNVDTAFGLHAFSGLDKRFLFYFCKSYDFTERDKGSGRPSLVKSDLYTIPIPIPPLQEQKQIVKILDQAFAAIDKAKANIERNIQSAEELFQSKLNKIFSGKGEGWEEKKIGELCKSTSNIKWNEHKGELQYIDLSSVSRDTLEVMETKTISSENAPSRAKKIVQEGDIIFGTTRPTLKRVTIIEKKYSNQICSTGFAVLRSNTKIVKRKFLFYYLQTSFFMDEMKTKQRGTSYPAVTDKDVKNIRLNLNKSIEKQNIYVGILDNLSSKTNELKSKYKKKLYEIEQLKKSILDKAFKGELTQ